MKNKYNLNQKIYFLNDNIIYEGVITGINVFYIDWKKSTRTGADLRVNVRYAITFTNENGDLPETVLFECCVFPDMKSILKYLQDNVITMEKPKRTLDEVLKEVHNETL